MDEDFASISGGIRVSKPGDVSDIAWYQREDAGREKGHDAGDQGQRNCQQERPGLHGLREELSNRHGALRPPSACPGCINGAFSAGKKLVTDRLARSW